MPNRSDAKKAMRLYRQASRSLDLRLRQHLLLASAKAFHHAGKNDRYLSILNEIDPKQLEDRDYVDFVLSRAEIAAKKENWLSAEAMLEEKRFKAIDSSNKVSNSLRLLELQIALGITLGNVNG